MCKINQQKEGETGNDAIAIDKYKCTLCIYVCTYM